MYRITVISPDVLFPQSCFVQSMKSFCPDWESTLILMFVEYSHTFLACSQPLGGMTLYSRRIDSQSGQNDFGRTGHRAKQPASNVPTLHCLPGSSCHLPVFLVYSVQILEPKTHNALWIKLRVFLDCNFIYWLQTYQKSIMLLLAMMEKGLKASSFPECRLHQETTHVNKVKLNSAWSFFRLL